MLLVIQAASDTSALAYILPAAGGLIVGWLSHAATVKSSKIGADVETQKLAHEQDKHYAVRRDKAEEDYRAAADAMEIAALVDIDVEARRASAREARKRLLGVSWTLGRAIGGRRFEELIGLLDDPDEARLLKAVRIWPAVDKAMRTDAPPRAAEHR